MTTLRMAAVAFLALIAAFAGLAEASCSVGGGKSRATAKDSPATYDVVCADAIKNHIKLEFKAALQYLVMGVYFGQDTINLEGFSKMFYEHASEERTHGVKFIDYLRMRGNNDIDFFGGGESELKPVNDKYSWRDGEEALRDALDMEKSVTRSIKKLVDICEKDFHAADWLTGTWLDEQFLGQRHLAEMINTFANFRETHEELADWMFSQHLLTSA